MRYKRQSIEQFLDLYSECLENILNSIDENAVIEFNHCYRQIKGELSLVTQHIFENANLRTDELCSSPVFTLLDGYEDNIRGNIPEKYESFEYQRALLTEFPEDTPETICCARTDIEGRINSRELCEIINEIIDEQNIFRISYEPDENMFYQYRYQEHWDIPFMDISFEAEQQNYVELFKAAVAVPYLYSKKKLL